MHAIELTLMIMNVTFTKIPSHDKGIGKIKEEQELWKREREREKEKER